MVELDLSLLLSLLSPWFLLWRRKEGRALSPSLFRSVAEKLSRESLGAHW